MIGLGSDRRGILRQADDERMEPADAGDDRIAFAVEGLAQVGAVVAEEIRF